MHETLSIKVTTAEKARLRKLAQLRGIKLSALMREGLKRVTENIVDEEQPSCYQIFAKYYKIPGYIGESQTGDLSTNKARLKNFGRKHK